MPYLFKNKLLIIIVGPILLYVISFPFFYNNPEAPLYFNLYSLYQGAFEHQVIDDNREVLVQNNQRYEIGDQAPDFELENVYGEKVSLSNQQGKYVLLTFWASWCPVCRKENKNLVHLYDRYKDSDFEIVAVSLDRSITNWEKAIDTDHSHWIQVSDLQGVDSEIATSYGVYVTPTTFLISPEGKIVKKNINSEELEEELKILL